MESKKSSISLLKVPKFLAEQWRKAENQSVIGSSKRNASGELEELLVRCEAVATVFKCRKTLLPLPTAVQVLYQNGQVSLKGIAKFDRILTAYPALNGSYREFVAFSGNLVNTKCVARSTITECREDPAFDSTDTVGFTPRNVENLQLFKYFNPRPATVAALMSKPDYGRLPEEAPLNRAKNKGNLHATLTQFSAKLQVKMDSDELKMRIFKIFESEEGKDGVQLKRVVQLTGQPMLNVKQAVEEIAVPKKRTTDHKLVYFLRDQYQYQQQQQQPIQQQQLQHPPQHQLHQKNQGQGGSSDI